MLEYRIHANLFADRRVEAAYVKIFPKGLYEEPLMYIVATGVTFLSDLTNCLELQQLLAARGLDYSYETRLDYCKDTGRASCD